MYTRRRKTGTGEITKISSLFDVYKNRLRAPQKSVIDATVEVIEDMYGWKIAPEHITYKTGSKTLSFTVFGPQKTELQLKKDEILAHLKGRLGEASAPKEIL